MTDMPPPPVAPPLSVSDERLWASLAHFGNILGFLPSLLIFLILGPRSTKVKAESREALNFVLTAIVAEIVLAIVGAILVALYIALPDGIDTIFSLLGSLVSIVQWLLWLAVVILSIVAGVRVNQGGSYRYPFAIRLIK